MVRSRWRRRLLLGLAAGALGVTAVPVAAQDAPDGDRTQQVVVQADEATVTLQVTDAELEKLRTDPAGAPVVTRGRTVQAELARSVPLVGAPALWAGGSRGAGRVVVVIDSGVDVDFGGTLVGQACFAASQVGASLVGHCGTGENAPQAFDGSCFDLGLCRILDNEDVLDPSAGRPCSRPVVASSCAHGTAVAAVAARHAAPSGVAPDAGIYAIRVFEPGGRTADLVDILLALDHVRQLADRGLDIAAVNLSVATSSAFPGACDVGPDASDDALAFRRSFAQLAERGIASVVASGNDGHVGSVALPACVSGAVSVGASDLGDRLADFGNRGPGLDLVAPGAAVGTGAIGPLDIPGGAGRWAGTSFSAPHVAGAFALLQPQYPKASVDQLVAFLRATGVPIADASAEGSAPAAYPRLRLLAPDQALHAGVLFATDQPVAGTARPAMGDFDGDGHADVLAHGPGAAPDRIAYGTDGWQLDVRSRPVSGSYQPLIGSFRGVAGATGAADDILWYAPGAAADSLWSGDATRTLPAVPLTVNGTYAPVVADFDGDGFDDILWYAAGRAADSLWYGGPAGFTTVSVSVAGTYRVVAGDFDGDGFDDLVFHGPGAAADSLWRGTSVRGRWGKGALAVPGTSTLRAGDLDGDGDDDLVVHQPGDGADSIWRGGPAVGSGGTTGGFSPLPVTVSGTYEPVVGDLDGDGRDDIVWYEPGPGADAVWFGQAAGPPRSRAIVIDGAYLPLIGDVDGDDGEDIVWFDPASTRTPVWWSHVGPSPAGS